MNSVEAYLQTWRKRSIVQNFFLAVAAFLAGLVIVFLTFWFVYAIIYWGWIGVIAIAELVFHKRPKLTHEWRLIASGVVIGLLFIQHFRSKPQYWGNYAQGEYPERPLPAPGVGGSLFILLRHPGTSANMIVDILLSGPRLMFGSVRMLSEALRLRTFDTSAAAELLSFLLQRGRLVSYEELREAGWEPWLEQFRCIEGLNFLQKGLSLSEDLRVALRPQSQA